MDDIPQGFGGGEEPPSQDLLELLKSKASYLIGIGLFVVGNGTGYWLGHKSSPPPAPVASPAPAASVTPPPAVKKVAPAPSAVKKTVKGKAQSSKSTKKGTSSKKKAKKPKSKPQD